MGWDGLSAERDRLLIEGREDEAWELVSEALSRLPSGDHAETFLEASVSLALTYHGHREAGSWITAYRRRAGEKGLLDPGLREFLQVLQFTLHLALRELEQARTLEASIRWPLIDDRPSVFNIRLYYSVFGRGNDGNPLGLLRNCRARFRAPYDLGNRLRLIGAYFRDCADWRRYLRFYQAALAHFQRDSSLRSRLMEIELRGTLGRAFFNNGLHDEARDHFLATLDAARHCRLEGIQRNFSCELARIYSAQGRVDKARELLASVPPRRDDTPAALHADARILTSRVDIAIDAGELAEARRHARHAQNLLDRSPYPFQQAYLDAVRGRLEARSGGRGAHQRALRHLDRAERCLRGLGARGLHGLSRTLVIRGHVHLRRKEAREALECCRRSMELARENNYLPEQARSLLLKSYLLIEAGLPGADQVYEEVLRDLGLVKNPVLLFKVIANLYMYSWNLDDGLDLLDHHLRQLDRLRESIDDDIYRDLYGSYVTRRVIERWMRHAGIENTPLPDE